MVKIPIGSSVIVNLWNKKKKRGMVKYIRDTMYLIKAESEFEIDKGDDAIVVESYEGFVVIVPEDKFSKLINGKGLKAFDHEGFSQVIWEILDDRKKSNGGILSFEELFSVFKRSSIQAFLKKRDLKKILKRANPSFEIFKFNGIQYVGLKPGELTHDIIDLLKFAEENEFITPDMIQTHLGWRDVRLSRMLEYLIRQNRVRKGESYKTGTRYYFINLNK